MSMVLAVILIVFGLQMRRTTMSPEWRLVANTALVTGVLFVLYTLAVFALFI